MPLLRQSRRFPKLLRVALLALIFPVRSAVGVEPDLRIVVGPRTTSMTGRIDSEASAIALETAMKTARPDLPPDRTGLLVDADAPNLSVSDLKSLLAEIALSTHEGRLEIWPDRLVIGGLTDSLVTQSALRIRAEPFLRTRILQNRLCIVSTDDLPDIAVALADGSKVAMEAPATAAAKPRVETPFEAPGIRLEKLLAALALLADPAKLGAPPPPSATTPSVATTPMRAEPLPAAPATVPDAGREPSAKLTATPVETLEPLSPVSFSSNSFLLQANQNATLDSIAKHLLSPGRAGFTVRLDAMKPSGGSSTFNDYLCERRISEVTRLLAERGVDPAILRPDTLDSRSPIDSGEVRLTVVIPPLPVPDPVFPAPGNGSPNPFPASAPLPPP